MSDLLTTPAPQRRRLSELGEPEKWCPRCSEYWPADPEFFFAKNGRGDGLFYCCKACYLEWKIDNKAKKHSATAQGAAA